MVMRYYRKPWKTSEHDRNVHGLENAGSVCYG